MSRTLSGKPITLLTQGNNTLPLYLRILQSWNGCLVLRSSKQNKHNPLVLMKPVHSTIQQNTKYSFSYVLNTTMACKLNQQPYSEILRSHINVTNIWHRDDELIRSEVCSIVFATIILSNFIKHSNVYWCTKKFAKTLSPHFVINLDT